MEHEGDRWIENIQKQTVRLGRLVNDLVALSRLDEEAPFPEKEDFSLSDAAWEAAEPFAALAQARGKRYAQRIEDGLVLHGDRDSVRQLISILLDNAVRHSDEGGDIRMEVCRKRGRACIQVENSCSLPQTQDLSRLFDRFFTVESARKSTGLGLAIARSLVEQMGGSISAEYTDDRLHIWIFFRERGG